MKALGQVLNGLVLQPRGMTGDIIEQKSKLFQQYVYTHVYVHVTAHWLLVTSRYIQGLI